MASIYSFDANRNGVLICPITVRCGNINRRLDNALLDTGAGMCHITYALWCKWGFDRLCFNGNPSLMNLAGFASADEMEFDRLPLAKGVTRLGNDNEISNYEFRLDSLTLGVPTIGGSPYIPFNNISVKIIDSDKLSFIVGWNVLKYTTIQYVPSIINSICSFSFTKEGEDLMQRDRADGVSNCLPDIFSYRKQE
jgi:hypothetical protein